MKMRVLLAVVVALFLSTSAMAAVTVDVTVGKGTILKLDEYAKRVSIADSSVADVILVSPGEMIINGRKMGSTSLIVWDDKGDRTFYDLVVSGDIEDLKTKIAMIAPDAEVQVEKARESIILQGTLKNEDTIKKIETLSKAYATNVLNFMRPEEPQQVVLEVKVAQIDKTKMRELGLSALAKGIDSGNAEGFVGVQSIPSTTDAGLGGSAGLDVTPGIQGFDLDAIVPQIGVTHFPSGVSAFIKALSDKGLSKLLAEPNLVVRSGEKGSFLAGSRIPVQQISGLGTEATVSITYEEVGVKLNFAPEVLDNGIIHLKIDPAEVSNLVQFLTFSGITAPQIDTRTVSTTVDLKEGESLILAGLLSEETKKNLQKIPILGDIPILGALFRSSSDELERTELAFFITPRLVKPIAPGAGVPAETPGFREFTDEEKDEQRWIPLLGAFSSSKSKEEKTEMASSAGMTEDTSEAMTESGMEEMKEGGMEGQTEKEMDGEMQGEEAVK